MEEVKYEVRLTSICELEIANAALWWAEHRDLQQAMDWFDGIHETLSMLENEPERNKAIHEQSMHEWKHTYRQLLYGLGKQPTHRAVYRIHETTVHVVTVRHLHQRDLEPGDLE